MTDLANQMQHIAMATYADVDRLDLTLRDLAADAVPLEQVCLIGCAPHIDAIKVHAGADLPSHIQILLDRTQAIATLSNGEELVAAPQPFAGIDFDQERQAQGLLHGLEQMLIDGVLALLVKSRSISEFVAVTRALLRYSSHQVRTREVADRLG